MKPISILFIAGLGRSGSTLLSRLLGSLDGVCNLGELTYLWRRGFIENQCCSCGSHFRSCAFWRSVLEVYEQPADETLDELARLSWDLHTDRNFARLPIAGRFPSWRAERRRYLHHTNLLLRAISEATGKHVFVDSTKNPLAAQHLSALDGIEPHLIHLIRDVRGCVRSWQAPKHDPSGTIALRRRGFVQVQWHWQFRNLATEWVGRRLPYHRLRYEQLVERPEDQITELFEAIAPLRGNRLRLDGREVELKPVHLLGGNPNRFQEGTTELREDDRWRTDLPAWKQSVASTICGPLLRRYGYG